MEAVVGVERNDEEFGAEKSSSQFSALSMSVADPVVYKLVRVFAPLRILFFFISALCCFLFLFWFVPVLVYRKLFSCGNLDWLPGRMNSLKAQKRLIIS